MKFGVIYADPAWQFKVYNRDTGSGRSAESHYPTMSMDELKKLNVPSLATKDCALFMWAVCSMLPEALDLVRGWNDQIENPREHFKYKTVVFAWAKLNKRAPEYDALRNRSNWFMGMGYWSRQNIELCLLFTRGHIRRKAKDVPQLIVEPRREHSRKPDCVYGRIERLIENPSDLYLELFARHTHPGWYALGNEIDGLDLNQAIANLASLNDEIRELVLI